MKRVFRRLRARGGESFAEILVALLIVALATLLLASMVGASGSIDMATRKEDAAFYEAVTAVETGTATATPPAGGAGGGTSPQVTVKVGSNSFDIAVTTYEQDGLTAYEKR